MRFGYLSRLERDLERWVAAGTVDADAAGAMLADARSRKGGYSFSSVVVFLGVVSLALGAMTFVAANWQDIPRFWKVLLVLGAMWAALVAASTAYSAGRTALADALVMLGAGLFGASIMLVGQIYHLQGRAESAVLVWSLGSLGAAALARSRGALWLAIVLFGIWLVMDALPEFGERAEINYLFPVLWLGSSVIAWWLKSRLAAHLLALAAVTWIAITVAIVTARNEDLTLAAAVYAALFVLIAATHLALRHGGRIADVAALALAYCVTVIIAMTGFWIAVLSFNDDRDEIAVLLASISIFPMAVVLFISIGLAGYAFLRARSSLYDLAFCAFWIAVSIFAITPVGQDLPFLAEATAVGLSIWFIRMGGRIDVPSVTRLGYLAFALVMGLLYFRTAGSLLGTSGFYLSAGLAMVIGALLLPRLLRGGRARKEEEASQ